MNKKTWIVAYASVVGENFNNGGRAWNTNNSTIIIVHQHDFMKLGLMILVS